MDTVEAPGAPSGVCPPSEVAGPVDLRLLRVTALGTTYFPLSARGASALATSAAPTCPNTPAAWDGADERGVLPTSSLHRAGTLDLRSCGLAAPPPWLSLLPRVVALDLSQNPLRILPAAAVLGLPHLAKLSLRECGAVSVLMDQAQDPVNALLHLNTLDLRGNPGGVQTPRWLDARPALRVLRDRQDDPAGCEQECKARHSSALSVSVAQGQPSPAGAFVDAPTVATGGHPGLRVQLATLKTGELRRRLTAVFGLSAEVARLLPDREAVMDALCLQYARAFPACQTLGRAGRPTTRLHGQPLSHDLVSALRAELEATEWPKRQRPRLESGHYMTLGMPQLPRLADDGADGELTRRQKKARAVFEKHRRLWEAAHRVLSAIDPNFGCTEIAVTCNFRGSPHIDVNDKAFQYAISLGDFEGGGALCVEATPVEVVEIDTRHAVARMDGRFPHWVTGYTGTRYSVIWYKTYGEETPVTTAVFSPTDYQQRPPR